MILIILIINNRLYKSIYSAFLLANGNKLDFTRLHKFKQCTIITLIKFFTLIRSFFFYSE